MRGTSSPPPPDSVLLVGRDWPEDLVRALTDTGTRVSLLDVLPKDAGGSDLARSAGVIVFDARQLGIRECLVINDVCRMSPTTRVVVLGTARADEPAPGSDALGVIATMPWSRAAEVLCRLVADLRTAPAPVLAAVSKGRSG